MLHFCNPTLELPTKSSVTLAAFRNWVLSPRQYDIRNFFGQLVTFVVNTEMRVLLFPLVWVQVVCLGDAPPTSELVVAEKKLHAFTEEGATKDRDAGSTSTSADIAVAIAHGDHKGADDPETTPGSTGLDGSFDREAVDALCRQAASDFFLYGAQHRGITTPP